MLAGLPPHSPATPRQPCTIEREVEAHLRNAEHGGNVLQRHACHLLEHSKSLRGWHCWWGVL